MYTITPKPNVLANALESWGWIGLSGKRPILVTAFGDVFFDSPEGIWLLDAIEGKLKNICQTQNELDRILTTDEGKDLYFLSGFVDRAVREKGPLKEDECYDFRIHPVVGGAIEYSNIETMSFLVSLNLRGQLHDQVRHMKPGTKISKFVMVEEKKSKPWWKFWK